MKTSTNRTRWLVRRRSAPPVVLVMPTLVMICSVGLAPHATAQAIQAVPVAATDATKAEPEDGQSSDGDIVVTAKRRGDALVPAESEFDESEIGSHGANSIQDLLNLLSPFIDPNGEEPVILINGRPAGFDRSILSYPPEALARLAVLKPEAAAHYGVAAGKRVVNLLLKPKFSSVDADAGVSGATRGGQSGGHLGLTRVAITGETRWNIQMQFGRDGALPKNARHIARDVGIFDEVGYVTSPDGGPLAPTNPALGTDSGVDVIVAGIPVQALYGKPTLDDFAVTAGQVHTVDPNAYETLRSRQQTFGVNAGITRPLGALSLSLNLNATGSRDQGMRGLPMGSFIIPGDSPWSPFSHDVVLVRPFAGSRPLKASNRARSFDGSLTLNGLVDGWQGTLSVSYGNSRTDSLFETGLDFSRIQQAIDALDPTFNPYGVWDEDLLLASRSRSDGENLSARLSLQKAIASLPAGPLAFSVTADARRDRATSHRRTGGNSLLVEDLTQSQSSGQVSLVAPISARSEKHAPFLGDLAINLSIGGQLASGLGSQLHYGGGIDWSPVPLFQVRGAIDHAETAPPFALLTAPEMTMVNRIFDYKRHVIAEPIWIAGGNPDLARGSRQIFTLSGMVRPLGNDKLSLNIAYQQSTTKGGYSSFPEFSPVVEAAFPERITRDATGRLISVDARAINIDRNTEAALSSGIALRLSGSRRRSSSRVTNAYSDPFQFGISLSHQYRLVSETLVRAGVPLIDALGVGGQSRHSVNLQIDIGKRGIGATLNANWSSVGQIGDAGADPINTIRAEQPVVLNLSTFLDPAILLKQPSSSALGSWRLSLDVQNVLNGYQHVRLGNGTTPAGFSHDEIDPLGRTARLVVRKRF